MSGISHAVNARNSSRPSWAWRRAGAGSPGQAIVFTILAGDPELPLISGAGSGSLVLLESVFNR